MIVPTLGGENSTIFLRNLASENQQFKNWLQNYGIDIIAGKKMWKIQKTLTERDLLGIFAAEIKDNMDQLENIQNLIYVIRGQRVMLNYDLAQIYQVETAQLKRQVRRNIERFEGDDFMFELSHEEFLRCQIGTSSWGGGHYGFFCIYRNWGSNA